MGIRLIVEILDHAPPDLSLAERLVLIVIAEEANDGTRKGWPPLDAIADRAGLTPDGVKHVIQRLRRRGYDIRLPLKVGRDGRAVYSWRGRSITYAMPSFPQRDGPGAERRAARAGHSAERRDGHTTLSPEKGGTANTEGGTAVPERRDGQPTPSPHIPSDSPHPSSSARANGDGSEPSEPKTTTDGDIPEDKNVTEVARRIDVTHERAKAVVDEIRQRFDVRNLKAYIATMGNDKLRELADEIGSSAAEYEGVWAGLNQQPNALKECRKCERPFRPKHGDDFHCRDCNDDFNAVIASKLKSRKQQETDAQFDRAMARAEEREEGQQQ